MNDELYREAVEVLRETESDMVVAASVLEAHSLTIAANIIRKRIKAHRATLAKVDASGEEEQ